MRLIESSLFLLLLSTLAACGALGDDDGGGSTITVGDTSYELAAGRVTGKMDGHSVYQLNFALPDASLTITVPRLNGAPVPLYPYRPESLAIYAPTSGEPYTLHGAMTNEGWIALDDANEAHLAGSFALELSRLSGEAVSISGELSGVRLEQEEIVERGSTLTCRMRAYSVFPNVDYTGSNFGNNASADVIVIDADLTPGVGVTIFMPRDIQPGSYPMDGTTYHASARDNEYFGKSTSGTLTIEGHDAARRYISGGFAFSGDANHPTGLKVPLLVNGGSFGVYYFEN